MDTNIAMMNNHLSLPTISSLVSRQLEIQARAEAGDLDPAAARSLIENLSKIIAGIEMAEQAPDEIGQSQSAGNEQFESNNAQSDAFAIDSSAENWAIEVKMRRVYEEMETGKISGNLGLQRIRALDLIARSTKEQITAVQVNIGEHTQMSAGLTDGLAVLENKLRNLGEQIDFASKEIARLASVPVHHVLERIRSRQEVQRLDKRMKGAPGATNATGATSAPGASHVP